MEQTLPKKSALVTGASRGIGKAIAIALAKEHYDLYLTCHHNQDLLEQLKQQLEQDYSITCRIFVGDMGDFSFVSNMFTQIHSLDVLVNNAGISYIGLLQDMSIADWDTVMKTNLYSVFYTSKLATPLMLAKKEGKMINISSMWGNSGASTEVAYSASKGGVNSFTQALAKELAPSNIQVNAIACGVIDTDMNQCFSQKERAELISSIPADRMGEPNEVAAMVLSLIHAPSYLTGQIITLDGGYQ